MKTVLDFDQSSKDRKAGNGITNLVIIREKDKAGFWEQVSPVSKLFFLTENKPCQNIILVKNSITQEVAFYNLSLLQLFCREF